MNNLNITDMLYIEYTKNCNSKCTTCDYWKNNLKPIDIDKEILDSVEKLYNKGLKVVLFTGGEALLEGKRLFNIANKMKQKCPELQLRILTNGILAGKYADEIINLFDSIVFSLDTIDEKKYNKIRGVNAYKIVSENIKLIREKSSKIQIRLRAMLLEENIDELYEIVKYAINMKVNKLSFLLVDTDSIGFGRESNQNMNNETIKNEIDVNMLEEQIKKIKKEYLDNDIAKNVVSNLNELSKFIKEKKIIAETCNAPLTSIVINSYGDILPCFFKNKIGNLKENDIVELLNSKEYIEIYNQRKERKCKECKKCIL